MYCSDGLLPRAYGLPKVHKPDCPFRIIISSIDSPLYSLATFLQETITRSLPRAKGHIDNSFQLVKILKDMFIEDGFVLISLDVVSLFTNIPIDLAMEGLTNRWNFISDNCNIPKNEFLDAVRLVLNSTYFSFDNNIYRQNYGTPMGSPISPIIADIVMQDLEKTVLGQICFPIPIYFRYVDDILLAVPINKTEFILQAFNQYHPRLQFTLELGGHRINFLDTTIILNNNTLKLDWYHKPSYSGRYLNYLSQHPMSQKRGTILSLIDRAFLLSHPEFHKKNFEFVIRTLLNNDYPIDFIFHVMSDRLKSLTHKKTFRQMNTSTNESDIDKIKWFTIPYVNSLSKKFNMVTVGTKFKLVYRSLNKLNSLIKVLKDPLPNTQKKNVVYKICCKDCDASYVGQTGRLLKTRVSEHLNHIRRNTTTPSVITDHRMHLNHDFDWNKVMVLDTERFYHKRLISEMIYIKRQNNGLNLQRDTEGLDHGYSSLFHYL